MWQGTVRLMYRIGGSSKKAAPQYVERVVEKPVDRIVERIVEKVVRDTVSVENEIFRLFDNVYFDFDMAAITAESQPVLDDVATIMKSDTSRHFLIMGFTDARGSEAYNVGLSERRGKLDNLIYLLHTPLPRNHVPATRHCQNILHHFHLCIVTK